MVEGINVVGVDENVVFFILVYYFGIIGKNFYFIVLGCLFQGLGYLLEGFYG